MPAEIPLTRRAFLENARRSPGAVEYAVTWGELIDAIDWPESGSLQVHAEEGTAEMAVIGGRFRLFCVLKS